MKSRRFPGLDSNGYGTLLRTLLTVHNETDASLPAMIARVLSVSVRKFYRFLASASVSVVRRAGSATAARVQASRGLSDFGGPGVGGSPLCSVPGSVGQTLMYAVPARRAESETDVTGNGRGVRGETSAGESSIGYIQRRVPEIVAKSA